ncbi:MAG: SPASM domain-containing protein [Candidatus Omnitrophica bacterium]|nr:SPASM domain-containing protein [Candidatus Omnitrophota bacterium]
MRNKINFLKGYVKRYVVAAYKRQKLQAGEFPPQLWIENTNHCNAACVMCPRDKHNRSLGFMEFSLFERLIKEIAVHKNNVSAVHMHNYGEPLMDKELIKKVKLAKDYGIKHVYFVTNAALLTSDLSEKLIASGLDQFKISFYGTDRQTYNATMRGLDFDQTMSNVKQFFQIRKKMKSLQPKVIIQYLPQSHNKAEISKFKSIFDSMIDSKLGDRLNIYSLLNFGEGRSYNNFARRIVSSICNYPWRTMVVLHDGRVTACCMDYNGVLSMGNVTQSTIKQIWNNQTYKKIREDFKKLDYKEYQVCRNCDLIF